MTFHLITVKLDYCSMQSKEINTLKKSANHAPENVKLTINLSASCEQSELLPGRWALTTGHAPSHVVDV
jgi:hypothetical protein